MSGFFGTAFYLTLVLVAYAIGKGVGRAQARNDQVPPIRLRLEVLGETTGTIEIHGMRVAMDDAPPTL